MAHQYLKIIDLVAELRLEPGAHHLEVLHDEGCGSESGQDCDCKPIAFLTHKTGLHEFAMSHGEAELVSIDGVPIQ